MITEKLLFIMFFLSEKIEIVSHLDVCVVDADKLIARFKSAFFGSRRVVKHLKKINIK